MTTFIIMESEALAADMDMDMLTADPADTITETRLPITALAAVALAVIVMAITALAAPVQNALVRAMEQALAPAAAMAKVLVASIAAALAVRNAATVQALPGRWTHTLEIWDKATNWPWAKAKALMMKKLLAAAAAKATPLEPAMVKVLLLTKAKALVLEKEQLPLRAKAKVLFQTKAKVRFLTKAKKQRRAKALALAPEKIAAVVRNLVPTRWNRQLVLNQTLLLLPLVLVQLLEWVLEVRALTVRTW